MRFTTPSAAALVVALSVAQAHAVSVQTTVLSDGPNHYHITLATDVAVSTSAVWTSLTDYTHHAEFMPYMTLSDIVQSSPTVVRQEGRIKVLVWTFRMGVTQQVQTTANTMRFRAIAGDFRQLEGQWMLSVVEGRTHLTCEFAMQPQRQVPEWAVRFATKYYLKNMIKALVRHAENVRG